MSSSASSFMGAVPSVTWKPMALGLLIKPARDPEAIIGRVKELGFSTCFFSLDDYLGKYTKSLAEELHGLLEKYGVTATTAEVVQPGPLKWNFTEGPATIGVVPRATRKARVDALKQTSDFAKLLGIPYIQTHCGFIPEDPADPLYEETVLTIRDLVVHCASNGQAFLMETGQETPTTMLRVIRDVNNPNLGVGWTRPTSSCMERRTPSTRSTFSVRISRVCMPKTVDGLPIRRSSDKRSSLGKV